MNNGHGAGGTDSPTAITETYEGTGTDSFCTGDPNNAAPSGIAGLTLASCVPSSSTFFSQTTNSGTSNSGFLAPTSWTVAGGDAGNLIITESWFRINNLSTLRNLEFDTNYHDSGTTYYVWGKHWSNPNQRFEYCFQGCSGWQAVKLAPAGGGSTLTTFALTQGHIYHMRTYDTRGAVGVCTPSSGSNCMFEVALCINDVTAATPWACYNELDATTGLTPGGIPVNPGAFATNLFQLQHQIDQTAASVTTSVDVDSATLTAYSLPSGTAVYFTADGSTPTTSSSVYTAPIGVTINPTTLKAIAAQPGHTNSNVASSTYSGSGSVCGDPFQTGPNFSGTYNVPPTVLPLSIGFTSPTAGCVMHADFSGGAANCSSATYSGTSLINSTTQASVIACQGGFASSNVVGGTWTIVTSTSPTPPQISVIFSQ